MIALLTAATLLTCNQVAVNFLNSFSTQASAVLLHSNGEGFTVMQQTETHTVYMHFAHPNWFKLYSTLFNADKKGPSCRYGQVVYDTFVRLQTRKPQPEGALNAPVNK